MTYSSDVLLDSPIAYWRLADTTGDVLDSGTGAHSGTYVGTSGTDYTRGVTGLLQSTSNLATSFLGGVGYITVPYGAWMDVDDLTIECVFRSTSSTMEDQNIIAHDTQVSGSRSWQLRIASGKLEFVYFNNSDSLGVLDGATTILPDTTYHVAAVWSGGASALGTFLYVNGVQDGTGGTVVDSTMKHLNAPIIIGYYPPTSLRPFIGTIDEVALYGTALTSARVGSHYAQSLTANNPPTANAGPDQTVEPWSLVTLTGTGTDTDGTIASYTWTQTSGPDVTSLWVGTGATRSFFAPGVAGGVTSTFSLTVTDNTFQTSTADSVSIVARAPTTFATSGSTWVPMHYVSLGVDPYMAPKISTLVTDFSDDREFGGFEGGPPGLIYRNAGQQLEIVPSGYHYITSLRRFDLRNSSIYVKLVQAPNVGTGTTQTWMKLTDADPTNFLQIGYWNNGLFCNETAAGAGTGATIPTYDPATMKWLRISHNGTSLIWSTSPDMVTWTTQKSKVAAIPLHDLDVSFTAGVYGTEPTPGLAIWDNLNTASMLPPAGTTLLSDLTHIANWTYIDPESTIVDLTGGVTGPGGDPVMRNTLVDGQRPSWDDPANERSDAQGPDIPLNSVRWIMWWERFVQMPDTTEDSWQLIGPGEIHGSTLPQATVMCQVFANKHRMLNANSGLAQARFFDLGLITLNQWVQYKMGVYYTQASNGWLELWRDGSLLVRIDGQTTSEAHAGYLKFANYRRATINGTSIYDASGVRVYG